MQNLDEIHRYRVYNFFVAPWIERLAEKLNEKPEICLYFVYNVHNNKLVAFDMLKDKDDVLTFYLEQSPDKGKELYEANREILANEGGIHSSVFYYFGKYEFIPIQYYWKPGDQIYAHLEVPYSFDTTMSDSVLFSKFASINMDLFCSDIETTEKVPILLQIDNNPITLEFYQKEDILKKLQHSILDNSTLEHVEKQLQDKVLLFVLIVRLKPHVLVLRYRNTGGKFEFQPIFTPGDPSLQELIHRIKSSDVPKEPL